MTDYSDMENKTTSQFLVYALHHPDSDHVYIGQSSRGMLRPQEHEKYLHAPKFARLSRVKWIKSLHAKGLKPEIAVLEEFADASELNDAERFYIAYFKSLGIPLLNCTEGGDGGAEISRRYWADPASREKKRLERLGYKHLAETKVRMSAASKGKKKSAEHCASMSEARRRNWENPEYRARQIAAQKAAKNSDKARAQAAEWAKLSSHDTHRSPEYRAKQSEIAKAACASDEVRERKSDAATLKAQDPEYIEKLSIARKKWWAKRKRIPT